MLKERNNVQTCSFGGEMRIGNFINNLRYTDDTTLMAETEEELKSLLKVKEESEQVGLKLRARAG